MAHLLIFNTLLDPWWTVISQRSVLQISLRSDGNVNEPMNTIGGMHDVNSRVVSISISPCNDDATYSLDKVLVTSEIPVLTSMLVHYNDVIMGAIASQITSLTIVYSIFYETQIKENIKAPRHWPLCGEFTGDRWIPRTNGQLRGKYFHLMTSSCKVAHHSHLSDLPIHDIPQKVSCPFYGGIATVLLTHWGRDKMAAIFQTTFSNAYSRMKMYEFRLKFHWNLFLRVQFTTFKHWFR